MPEDKSTRALEALRLYQDQSRDFLGTHLPVAVEGLDRRRDLLRAAVATKTILDIGFVGESQVGKSTLLNALLGEFALPSGGIGPLTAQAIHVRYAESPQFVARYHGKKKLNEARFAIERLIAAATGDVVEAELDGDPGELGEALEGEEGGGSRVAEDLVHAIEEVFGIPHAAGDQGRVAAHCLRLSLAQKVVADRELPEGVLQRVGEVSSLLGTECRVTSEEGIAAFRSALKLRAAGWHSPLVAELEVYLTAPVLQSLHLVDLPGVGTINDPSQGATKRFVREGDALAVVVRNNGVTQTVVNLLEKAEFITRWMWAAREGGVPIHAMVIVTHIDNVARGRFREAKQRARENGGPVASKESIFTELALEMADKVRQDLRSEFLRSPSFDSLDAGDYEARKGVVEDMCAGLRVHCVAAPDALGLQHGDTEDAFIREMDATGIPELRGSLADLAAEHEEKRTRLIEEELASFSELLEASVQRARQAYAESAEVGLVRRFREQAEPALAAIEKEMNGLHGRCLSRLSEGIPDQISALCSIAERAALKKLKSMRRHAEDLHYQSLNAALRRAGTWDNRGIDFPGGITRSFVEKVAGEWPGTVVEPVRGTLQEVAEQDGQLVQRLVSEAATLSPALVEGAQVGALVAAMKEAARSCVPWSKQHLDELRKQVEAQLSDAVMHPIARACEKAINAGRNRGTGAKKRIIQVFEDSGEKALETAKDVALSLLRGLYDDLFAQLQKDYLEAFDNPVRKVYEAITAEADSREEVERQALQAEVESFASAFLPQLEAVVA